MIQAMTENTSLIEAPEQALAALAVMDAPALGPAALEPGVLPLPGPAPAPAAAVHDVRVRMEDLVRQYGRLINVMVRRVGRQAPAHVREDIQQRVLISLWKQLRRAQAISHPTSYIYRTAVRETVRVMRQEAARAQEPIEPDGPAGLASPHDDPYAALARKEKLAKIRAAIAAIAPERRQAVWAHLSGFGVTEIMNRYGWPYQKARNLIARGMADVRRILKESGLGPPDGASAPAPIRRRVGRATPESIKSSALRVHQAKLRMLKLRGSRP